MAAALALHHFGRIGDKVFGGILDMAVQLWKNNQATEETFMEYICMVIVSLTERYGYKKACKFISEHCSVKVLAPESEIRKFKFGTDILWGLRIANLL